MTVVVRGDAVIATHLALGLMRSALEMEMLLRDRAGGTRYHKHGAASDGDALMRVRPALEAISTGDLVPVVYEAARHFKALVEAYDPSVEVNIEPLAKFVGHARG